MELLPAAGSAVVVWVAVRSAWAGFAAWRRHREDEVHRRAQRHSFNQRLDEVRARQAPARRAVPAWSGYRKFVVAQVVDEAQDVRSFYLQPQDGRPLPPFLPGQYLTFQVRLPDEDRARVRCYSLSAAPRPEQYRVSVKKVPGGRVSGYLHSSVSEGALLDVQAPRGAFHIDPAAADTAPVVLVGGGIGLTPLASMLSALVSSSRDAWFFYGTRNSRQHPWKEELQTLARQHANIRMVVCYSDPLSEDVVGQDYDHAGHMSLELLKKSLPSARADFFVCGPPTLMSAMTAGLEQWGVPSEQVHFEAFGPATVRRAASPAAGPDEGSVNVTFARSGKTCAWDPQAESVLGLAEQAGVAIESGCRAGSCGTCETPLRSGRVAYATAPGVRPAPGSCLTCVAVPDGDLVLDA